MKILFAVMLVLALVFYSCSQQPPKPKGYFVVNRLSIGSPVADVRKLVSKMSNDNFKTDDVPRSGKGMITVVGSEPVYFVFFDRALSEYYFTDFGGSEKKFNDELARFSASYGTPDTNIAKLPPGASNRNHGDAPGKFAFWVSPDKAEVLILEWAKKDDGVFVTLNSLLEDPLNKNLPHPAP